MSMCRVVSCVVGRRSLLWPVYYLGQTLLAFVLLNLVLQCQTCLLLQIFLYLILLHSSPLGWKGHLFLCVLTLEVLVGLHRTVQLQLLQHRCLGHRLGLLWYFMVYLVNKQRSFCCLWDCTQVLHFGRLPWWLSGKEYVCNAGDWVRFLGQEDPLEEGMATHSSILAWRIPWTLEPGRL